MDDMRTVVRQRYPSTTVHLPHEAPRGYQLSLLDLNRIGGRFLQPCLSRYDGEGLLSSEGIYWDLAANRATMNIVKCKLSKYLV